MENELLSEDKKEILSSVEVEVLSEFSNRLSKFCEHYCDVLAIINIIKNRLI